MKHTNENQTWLSACAESELVENYRHRVWLMTVVLMIFSAILVAGAFVYWLIQIKGG